MVNFSASQVGKDDFKDYLILGDDLAIFNKKVYDQLIKNLGIIGVSVSLLKCTEGKDGVEMAKRLFYKGEEVSPLPFGLLDRAQALPTLVLDFLSVLKQRDMNFALKSLLDLSFKNNIEKIVSMVTVPGPTSSSFDGVLDISLTLLEP